MTAHQNFTRSVRMAAILKVIEEAGMTVEVGTDFRRYRRIRLPQKETRPIYPMFDPASSFVDSTNGFWIVGHDQNGRLVHTQAMRLLDMRGGTLSDHFRDHQQKYVTPGAVEDPDSATFRAGRGPDDISGRVAYHGEFWVERSFWPARGARGYLGGGVVSMLSRLVFEMTEMTWSPDFVFAFCSAQHALKGAPSRNCYYNIVPGAWHTKDGAVFAEEWLLWMSAEDIAALTATPVESSFRVLEAAARNVREAPVSHEIASLPKTNGHIVVPLA